jgi:uncharacterized membrane protein YkoI
MGNNLTITISKKGAAIALGAAVFGAGTALLVDEVFFDNYPEYSYSSSVASSAPAAMNNNSETVAPQAEGVAEEAIVDEPKVATSEPVNTDSSPAPESAAAPQVSQSGITPDQAMQIAVEAAGGRAIDIYPGFEDGRDVFYVDIRDGVMLKEVYVDAMSGEVIKIETGP